MNNYIIPNWPAPKNIHVYTTTRKINFAQLKQDLNLPSEPYWLKQEHTNIVVQKNDLIEPVADASFSTKPNIVCVVKTADCLPILVCDRAGTIVAAIHAGWKGIAAGVIESTIKAMNIPGSQLLAWFGPAIGPDAFEVGNDVREIFLKADPQANLAFIPHQNKWLANIYLLGKQRLQNCGVTAIFGGDFCTFSQPDLFHSFRRDGEKSGRMANLIWYN